MDPRLARRILVDATKALESGHTAMLHFCIKRAGDGDPMPDAWQSCVSNRVMDDFMFALLPFLGDEWWGSREYEVEDQLARCVGCVATRRRRDDECVDCLRAKRRRLKTVTLEQLIAAARRREGP